MYNLAISAAVGIAIFMVVTAVLSPTAAVVPALLVQLVLAFVLMRRTGKQIELEMLKIQPMLEAGKMDEAREHIAHIRDVWGPWQILLSGQMDSQLGLLDYLQLKWDLALPKLEKGKWRNWLALTCIGAIHYRKGDKPKAWDYFQQAADASPKETIIWLVWATLHVRDGERTQALEVLAKALKEQPESDAIKQLHKRIANKKKIDVRQFPQTWYQIFPEEYAQQHVMRGRRGGPGPQQVVALPQPKMRGKLARRR